jgi:hypothetical protein
MELVETVVDMVWVVLAGLEVMVPRIQLVVGTQRLELLERRERLERLERLVVMVL